MKYQEARGLDEAVFNDLLDRLVFQFRREVLNSIPDAELDLRRLTDAIADLLVETDIAYIRD